MPKEEWGTKRLCPSCHTRFYDLGRDPMTCPACKHEFTLESVTEGSNRTLGPDKASGASKDDDLEVDADLDDDASDSGLDDDLLDDDDDDDVSLEEIADVPSKSDDDDD